MTQNHLGLGLARGLCIPAFATVRSREYSEWFCQRKVQLFGQTARWVLRIALFLSRICRPFGHGARRNRQRQKRSLPYDTDSAPRARIRARGVNSATAPPYYSMAPYLILRVRSRTGIVALLGVARRADVGPYVGYINPKKRADVRREGGFPIAVATGGRCRIFYLQVKYDSGSIHIKNRDADQLQ